MAMRKKFHADEKKVSSSWNFLFLSMEFFIFVEKYLKSKAE